MKDRILLSKVLHVNPLNYKNEIDKLINECKDEVYKEKIEKIKEYFEKKNK